MPAKKRSWLCFGVEIVAEVAEIQFEGRVGDDVIEGHQFVAVLVIGRNQRIALNDVLDGMHQVVQDQVQAQHAARFLRNILRVDGTAVFADGVRQVHQQRARTRGGVVGGHVLHGLIHQNGRHDLCHGMRRVILGILAAAVLVVILDQVFKDGGEEIELLLEDALETEIHQRVDQGAAEVIALGTVGDVVAQLVEQDDLRAGIGLDREDVIVEDGNVAQGVIEELGELFAGFGGCADRKDNVRVSAWHCRGSCCNSSISYCLSEYPRNFLLPVLRLRQFRVDLLHFIAKLVVHELVQKRLGNDLEFIPIIAQSIIGADAFEVVDQLFGLCCKILM